MHGGQEGTLPLVVLYRESSYPVLLNRTRALTMSPKLDLCTSRTYAATHEDFWLPISQLQCIYQFSLGASSIHSAYHRETTVGGVPTCHTTVAGE